MYFIDLKSGVPIYEQVYRAVVKLGAAGAFGETGQLPSVRAVAKDLGVNPNTVQKAYALLERDGIICSLPGKGSFLTDPGNVLEKRQREAMAQLKRAISEALESGLSPEELLSMVNRSVEQVRKTKKEKEEKHP